MLIRVPKKRYSRTVNRAQGEVGLIIHQGLNFG